MKKLSSLYFGLLFSFSAIGLPCYAENAKPLGYEIGIATYDDVYSSLQRKTVVKEMGVNKFTKGKVLQAAGTGLSIEGLEDVSFIFDNNQKLSGVLMSLPKAGSTGEAYYYEGFYKTYNVLQKNYNLVKQSLPVIGHLFAQFKKGDTTIEIEAGEASPNFDMRYLSTSFISSYQTFVESTPSMTTASIENNTGL